jgi:hypothetical protein
MPNNTRTVAVMETTMSQVVDIASRKPPQVSKHRFIGREHKSNMLDSWLNRHSSIWQLMRRNGLSLSAIEDAFREELEERKRRADRIERQREVLLQMPRRDGDTGPLSGPSAVRPTGFGGALLDAYSKLRRAA